MPVGGLPFLFVKHFPGVDGDDGSRSQKNRASFLLVVVPNEIQAGRARQRRPVVDVYGGRPRAVGVDRIRSGNCLVKKIPSDAGRLRPAESTRGVEGDVANS